MSNFGQQSGVGAGYGTAGGGGFGQPPSGGQPGMTPPPGGPGSSQAAGLVKLPSVAMIIFAIVSVLASMMVAISSVWSFAVTSEGGQLVAAVWSVVMIGAHALVAFGGYKMGRLQSYPLAMAAAVFCCVPFCTGWCCVVGIVPGAWSLFVLMKPEVKAAFT